MTVSERSSSTVLPDGTVDLDVASQAPCPTLELPDCVARKVKRQRATLAKVSDFVLDVLRLDRLLAYATGGARAVAGLHRVRKDYRQSPVGNAIAGERSKLVVGYAGTVRHNSPCSRI